MRGLIQIMFRASRAQPRKIPKDNVFCGLTFSYDYNPPLARTLNMVKKIPWHFGQWNPLEAPIC